VQHVQHQLHSPSTATALATSPFAFEHMPHQEHDGYEDEETFSLNDTESDENSSDVSIEQHCHYEWH